MLLSTVERHKKLVQDTRIFLRGRKGSLVVSSSNIVGVVMRTLIPEAVEIDACVAADALVGALKAAKKVELSVDGGMLVIRGSGMKAEIPVESGEPPSLPKVEDAVAVHPKDVKKLRDALPRVDIPRLGRTGQLSIRCHEGELFVACTDDVHGAIFRGTGRSALELGIFPQDAPLLTAAFSADGAVSMATLDGRVLLRSGGDAVMIPTTECEYIEAGESSAKNVATLDVADLRAVLSAVAPIASAEEASPVKFVLSDKGVRVSATSKVGSLSKAVSAKVSRAVEFGVSHTLLDDLLKKMSDKVVLGVFVENDVVTRIQFSNYDVVYAALTA